MSLAVRIAAASVLVAALLGAAAPASAAAKWVVDKAASQLGFTGSSHGSSFDGAFRRWDADIQFDPKALDASKAVVTVDLASAISGDDERDDKMPTSDWFDVARFAQATFTTRSIKAVGEGRYTATGDLNLHGVSKPIELPFSLTITGDQAMMTGEVSLNRLDFGIGQANYGSGDEVALDVVVKVRLSAHRAP